MPQSTHGSPPWPIMFWAGANEVKVEAQLSITRGSVSGTNHKPSKAGTAPNNDTGVLKNNIETISTGPLTIEVQSKAPYAVIHEYGGTIEDGWGKGIKIKLDERPYMRPAAKKMKPVVAAIIKDRLDNTLKRKG